MKEPNTPLGNILRRRRKALALTQADLGRRTGLTPSSISMYETGVCQPNLDSLVALSRVLDIGMGEFEFLKAQTGMLASSR